MQIFRDVPFVNLNLPSSLGESISQKETPETVLIYTFCNSEDLHKANTLQYKLVASASCFCMKELNGWQSIDLTQAHQLHEISARLSHHRTTNRFW